MKVDPFPYTDLIANTLKQMQASAARGDDDQIQQMQQHIDPKVEQHRAKLLAALKNDLAKAEAKREEGDEELALTESIKPWALIRYYLAESKANRYYIKYSSRLKQVEKIAN